MKRTVVFLSVVLLLLLPAGQVLAQDVQDAPKVLIPESPLFNSSDGGWVTEVGDEPDEEPYNNAVFALKWVGISTGSVAALSALTWVALIHLPDITWFIYSNIYDVVYISRFAAFFFNLTKSLENVEQLTVALANSIQGITVVVIGVLLAGYGIWQLVDYVVGYEKYIDRFDISEPMPDGEWWRDITYRVNKERHYREWSYNLYIEEQATLTKNVANPRKELTLNYRPKEGESRPVKILSNLLAKSLLPVIPFYFNNMYLL
ncbi:hypothetical protein Barb6_03629 [Bacteroidales bacterium Barb6]|nr:hypothetical protein Barb6_03629 [Bacteroidales bacterium Barb6]